MTMNLFPDSRSDRDKMLTRRAFLAKSTTGLGALALASLLNENLFAAEKTSTNLREYSRRLADHSGGVLTSLHFPPKAKRIIYLFMSGAPSHLDLFDYKPKLKELTGKDLPESVRGGQRITGMTSK